MKILDIVCAGLKQRPWSLALLMLTLIGNTSLANDESVLVYDNVFNTSGEFFSMDVEFGDEVILAGTARVFENFEIEYFGQFAQDNNHKAVIRFYLNDGAEVAPGVKAPGTLLVESDPLILAPGRNNLSFDADDIGSDEDLILPNVFTWTIEIQGFNGNNDKFGILLSDPVYIGNSFRDFWNVEADSGEFGPRLFSDGTAANFSQRIYASGGEAGEPNDQKEDKPFVFRITDFDAESNNWTFYVDGTEDTRYSLEFSSDLTQWTSIISLRTAKEPTPLTFKLPLEGSKIFFRTVYSDPKLEDFIVDKTNIYEGEVDLKVIGGNGLNVRIEWKSEFTGWRPLVNLTVANQEASYVHQLPFEVFEADYRIIVLP